MPKSSPSLFKLIELAGRTIYNGYFGGPASFAEPPVAGFSRGIVDSDNNLVLSNAEARALLVLLQQSPNPNFGTVPLDQDNVYVVTDLNLPEDPVGVICQVLKDGAAADNIGWNVDYTSLSRDGFVVYFDAVLPPGYYLSYIILTA